jgi:trypsin-like peptidase
MRGPAVILPLVKSHRLWRTLALVACIAPALAQNPNPSGSSSPANAVVGSQFRALRSISGSSGHEVNGRFVMDDPRSVFTAGKDGKVIVYFEWEGSVGPHHFEGLWKSPEGKIVLISDFRYEAKAKQFSGYWTMLLSDSAPSGEWNLEARIDGEFAGSHSFLITGLPSAATLPPAPPPRQPLAAADLYKHVMDATVTLEKLASDGSVLNRSSGFWVGKDTILTTFEALDGAASLRVLSPDGTRAAISQVLAWNRWQDWALLNVPRAKGAFLKRAPNLASVGDHCVFLETDASGSRLTDGTITGKNTFPRGGDRFLVNSAASATSIGGPLLDEFGDYVGVIGGTVVPGVSAMKMLDLMREGPSSKTDIITYENGAMAVPISQVPEVSASSAETSLEELGRRGEFLAPITKSGLIGFAQLAVSTGKAGNRSNVPREYRSVFSRREGHATVFVNWQPTRKAKGKAVLQVFNSDNRKVAESKPQDLSLSPGNFLASSWDVSLGNLTPAVYRVDLLFGEQTVWRDFFRVTD